MSRNLIDKYKAFQEEHEKLLTDTLDQDNIIAWANGLRNKFQHSGTLDLHFKSRSKKHIVVDGVEQNDVSWYATKLQSCLKFEKGTISRSHATKPLSASVDICQS